VRLPAVLSVEEVALLLQAAPGAKYKAALATAYGVGLRVSEMVALKVGDIDSERVPLRVEQGKAARTAAPCYRRSCLSCCAPEFSFQGFRSRVIQHSGKQNPTVRDFINVSGHGTVKEHTMFCVIRNVALRLGFIRAGPLPALERQQLRLYRMTSC
jgi:Phage integrase family